MRQKRIYEYLGEANTDLNNRAVARCPSCRHPEVPVVIPEVGQAVKWYGGHYVKLEKLQVVDADGTIDHDTLDTVMQELRDTHCLRGVKYVINWGEVEDGFWDAIDELAKRLYALRQEVTPKYARLILAIDLKTDGLTLADLQEMLPADLIVEGGYTPVEPGYTAYTLAFPYIKNGDVTGYYPKLWENAIQTRLAAFCQMIANRVPANCDGLSLDQGDILAMISTLESAVSDPYDTFQGGSEATYESGLFTYAQSMKDAFVHTPVAMSLNYDRAFIADVIPQLAAFGIGINTPNMNSAKGLNTSTGNVGILKYFQNAAYYDTLILNPEIQGDDYKATTGIDARSDKTNLYDFPSYESLYLKCRDTLHAHYLVWQRNSPFWLGGNYTETFAGSPSDPDPYTFPGTKPSVLTFLQTYPALIDTSDEHGGLNPTPPSNWI